MMFIGLAAMNSQANLLFAVFGLMIGVLLVAVVLSGRGLRRLDVTRHLPPSGQVGRAAEVAYDVTNRKRLWPTYGLTVAEVEVGAPGDRLDRQPIAFAVHVPRGKRPARLGAEVVPLRRGWHEFPKLQLSTSFPFGFVTRAVTRKQTDRWLVQPVRGAVEPKATLRFLSARSTGLNQRPREGGSDEMFGARDYRPGDPPRTIHWRRSARTLAARSPRSPNGSLVVKQMTRVAPPRLVVIVDTHAPPGADAAALGRVEKTLAVASSLVAAAAARGLSVGLVLYRPGDEGEFLEVRPGRGKRQRRELLADLAAAPRNDAADAAAVLRRGMALATGDTTGVFVTPGDAGEVEPPPRRRPTAAVGRGNLVTIRTATADLDRWVRFAPDLDWSAMVPVGHSA